MGRKYTAVPHEYLEEMEELTDEEFGRLIRGLLHYSMTGDKIQPEGNERFYAKRVMTTEDKFQRCFEETDNARSEKARKAANARWTKARADVADATDAQACSSTSSNAWDAINIKENKSNINLPKEKEKEKEKERENADAFGRFWAVYPKKVGKGEARKAFSKIKGVPVDRMISAVEAQKHSRQWTRDDGRYIPNPATWLNQGRWEDELSDTKVEEAKVYDIGDIDWLIEQGNA